MNAIYGIAGISALIYWFYVDATFIKIYATLLIVYIILTQIGTKSKYNNAKKKINISGWSGPNDPQIFVIFDWDLANSSVFLEKKKKSQNCQLL